MTYRIRIGLSLLSAVLLLTACTKPAPHPDESDPAVDTPGGTVSGSASNPESVQAPGTTPVEDTAPSDTTASETLPDETDPPAGDVTRPTLPADAVTVTTDWGIRSGAGYGRDNSLILVEKLASLPAGSTVYFPEGTYEVAFPMYIIGQKDLRLVGYKATLLRTGLDNTVAVNPPLADTGLPDAYVPLTSSTSFIYAGQNSGLTVEGFTFAYDAPTSLSGKVLSVDGGTATITLTDGSRITGGEYATVINTFTSEGVPDRTLEQYAEPRFSVEKIDDTTIRVSGLAPGGASNLQAGTRVCLRLCTGREYVIHAQGTTDLLFKDLTLRASYNGGILLTDRCADATLEHVRVQSDNPEALMSLNADALHVSDFGGKLTVNRCHFEGSGDDCINVHNMACLVDAVSQQTLTLTSPRFAFSDTWGRIGDTVTFYDPSTFQTLGTAEITAVDGQQLTVNTLPAGVGKGTVVSNNAANPTVEIRHVTVKNTRARGFLLQTGRVTVEDCTFSGTALSAVLVAPDLENWFEMSPAHDLTIRRNTFVNCGSHAAGVIQIAASHDDPRKQYPAYIHSNIRIEDNDFSRLSTPAVYALCTEGLIAAGNTVDAAGYRGALIDLTHCRKVKLDSLLFDRLTEKDVTDLSVLD